MEKWKLYDLIVQAQNNDNTAMVELIRTFQPKLERTIRNFSYTNKVDEEDMKQEIAIKMLEGINRFSFKNIPSFWEYMDKIEQDIC